MGAKLRLLKRSPATPSDSCAATGTKAPPFQYSNRAALGRPMTSPSSPQYNSIRSVVTADGQLSSSHCATGWYQTAHMPLAMSFDAAGTSARRMLSIADPPEIWLAQGVATTARSSSGRWAAPARAASGSMAAAATPVRRLRRFGCRLQLWREEPSTCMVIILFKSVWDRDEQRTEASRCVPWFLFVEERGRLPKQRHRVLHGASGAGGILQYACRCEDGHTKHREMRSCAIDQVHGCFMRAVAQIRFRQRRHHACSPLVKLIGWVLSSSRRDSAHVIRFAVRGRRSAAGQ